MNEKLLIPEPPLQTLPTLALKLGIKEAMVLQQLHYRLLSSPHIKDGYTWYKHSYANWLKQFPFYSEKTISRAFLNLENNNIIISTPEYNPVKVMRTKWYRIDYEELYRVLEIDYDPISQTIVNFRPTSGVLPPEDPYFEEDASFFHSFESQNDCIEKTKQPTTVSQFVFLMEDKKGVSIKEELKEELIKKTNVEMNLDLVAKIIHYLNKQTNRNYRINNRSTQRLINARLKEGYQLEDFKRVIDLKVKQWLHNPKMKTYLRPKTLFTPTNFENYLVESKEQQPKSINRKIKPIVLDFDLGEEE